MSIEQEPGVQQPESVEVAVTHAAVCASAVLAAMTGSPDVIIPDGCKETLVALGSSDDGLAVVSFKVPAR